MSTWYMGEYMGEYMGVHAVGMSTWGSTNVKRGCVYAGEGLITWYHLLIRSAIQKYPARLNVAGS